LLSPVKAAIANPTGWEWSSPATCSGAPPRGSADGMFEYAFAIAVDSQGYIYVADQGNRRVQKFNNNGTFNSKVATTDMPWSIDVDGSDYVYVTLHQNMGGYASLVKYDTNFNQQWINTDFTDDTMWVGVSSGGTAYVTEKNWFYRLVTVSSSGVKGTRFANWGYCPGETYCDYASPYPAGVAVDSSGSPYLEDWNMNWIMKFSSGGTYQSMFEAIQTPDGLDSPNDIDFDTSDNLYLTNSYGDRIQKYTSAGTFISQFGTAGSNKGEMNGPQGVAVDNNGNVYVMDAYNNRIQKFRQGGPYYFYQIANMPAGMNVIEMQCENNIETTSTEGIDNPSADLRTYASSGRVLVDTVTNMTADRDWTAVRGESDRIQGKSYANNFHNAPGVGGQYDFYVPIPIGMTSQSVYVCPGASSLGAISLTCTGGARFGTGTYSTSFGTVTFTKVNDLGDGVPYWKLEGVSASIGAMADAPSAPTPTPGVSPTVSPSTGVSSSPTPTPIITVDPTVTPELTIFPTELYPTLTVSPTPGVCLYELEGECVDEFLIKNVSVTVNGNTAHICWETTIPSEAGINYGKTQDYGNSTEQIGPLTTFCQDIEDLDLTTVYYFNIIAQFNDLIAEHPGFFRTGSDIESGAASCSISVNSKSNIFDANGVSMDFNTDNAESCYVLYGSSQSSLTNSATVGNNGSKYMAYFSYPKDKPSYVYFNVVCTTGTNECSKSDRIEYISNLPETGDGFFVNDILRYFSIDFELKPVEFLTLTGLLLTTVPVTFSFPQFWLYGFLWILPQKKKKPWGIVYGAEDKKPIPFAIVRLFNQDGAMVKQTVTDLDGKYGFYVDPGNYQLVVEHQEHKQFMKPFMVYEKDTKVVDRIPLQKLDKSETIEFNLKAMFMNFFIRTYWGIGFIGLFVSFIAFVFYFNALNAFIFLAYIIQIVIMILLRPNKDFGYVYNTIGGDRVKGAFIGVQDVAQGRQIDVVISDEKGRFGLKLDKGEYILVVSADNMQPQESNLDEVQLMNGIKGYKFDTSIKNVKFGLKLTQ
jgi:hypothetical protein